MDAGDSRTTGHDTTEARCDSDCRRLLSTGSRIIVIEQDRSNPGNECTVFKKEKQLISGRERDAQLLAG